MKKVNKNVSLPFPMYEILAKLAEENSNNNASDYLKHFLTQCKIDSDDVRIVICMPRYMITNKDQVTNFLNIKVDQIVNQLFGN